MGFQRKNKKSTDFIERPLDDFNHGVKTGWHEKPLTNDDELLEIYEDESGLVVDVKKINVARRRGAGSAFLKTLFLTLLTGALAYGAYYYFFNFRPNSTPMLELSVKAPTQVLAGEDFFYELKYKNVSQSVLRDIKIEVAYPDNFVFGDSLPGPMANQNSWTIPSLNTNEEGVIKIKGRLFGLALSDNLFSARGNYRWDKFSLEFKTETTAITKIDKLGFVLEALTPSTALVKEDGQISLDFKNYQVLPEVLDLVINLPGNFKLAAVNSVNPNSGPGLKVEKISDNTWRLSGFDKNSIHQELLIKYQVQEKADNQEPIVLKLQAVVNNQNYPVWEQSWPISVLNSSLNLTLSLNGQSVDQAVNFGQTLNYSLSFVNHGRNSVKDVVIMATIEGDLVNWGAVSDRYQGQKRLGAIVWTKNEVPDLAELLPERAGRIDFSLAVNKLQNSDLGKDFQIKAAAKFSVAGEDINQSLSDNRSNVIVSRINSDLRFNEQILYFDEDNVPVGSGPLPPQAGEKTTLKVFWRLDNNLHGLNNVSIDYALPPYINYEGREDAAGGNINYDELNRHIVWNLNDWPIGVYQRYISFYISLTPRVEDINKIMLLSGGATASALDNETQAVITLKSGPKTTKLEDDDIAGLNNDGRVQ